MQLLVYQKYTFKFLFNWNYVPVTIKHLSNNTLLSVFLMERVLATFTIPWNGPMDPCLGRSSDTTGFCSISLQPSQVFQDIMNGPTWKWRVDFLLWQTAGVQYYRLGIRYMRSCKWIWIIKGLHYAENLTSPLPLTFVHRFLDFQPLVLLQLLLQVNILTKNWKVF